MTLTIFIVTLMVIGAISAADNETDNLVNVGNGTDFVKSIDKDQCDFDEFVSENENDILSADQGTFTDLANDIENADVELNLTKDYTYSSNDSSYKSGISINKPITINGNGFTIDGNNQARALMISSEGVILKNITFINCSSDDGYGGAIFWRTTNGNLYNCNFENCSAEYRGGAIYWLGESPIISECNFVNNNAIVGNAIWFDGKKGKLIDSYFNDEDIFNLTKFEIIDTTPKTFTDLANEITNATNILILHRDYYYSNNDSSYSYGIAISKNITIEGNGYTIDAKNQARIFSIQSSTVVLKDINFINGYINLGRKIGGGGISIANSANVTIINCTFINCSSMDYNSFGGAIKCMGSLINIYNSTFEGNNAGYGGCAISAGDYSTSNIINSTFINNYETRGVIFLSGTGVISNCIFINNSASTAGVVIRLGEFNGVINNSIFLNNTRYSIDSDDNGPVFVTIINNWFGNTVQDYSIKPQVYTGTLKNWLFLNSSCIENYDYEKLFNIKFSFFSYDAVSKLTRPSEIYPNINLTLSAINGTLNKQYATMNEDVIYIIVNQSGMVSAKYDNLQFDVIVKQIPIEKLVQNFTVRVLNTTFNKDAQIIVNIPNGKGNVTIKIANVTFENLIIKDGVVVQNISNFDAGQYLVNVTYNGNKYYNASSQIVNLTVQKASSTIKVHVKDSKYGEEVIVNVTSDINCQLSVKINNAVKNVDIVANELQSINFGKLNAGNYTVIVLFNGNKNYKNTSYTKEFKVSKTESSLTVQNKEGSGLCPIWY